MFVPNWQGELLSKAVQVLQTITVERNFPNNNQARCALTAGPRTRIQTVGRLLCGGTLVKIALS